MNEQLSSNIGIYYKSYILPRLLSSELLWIILNDVSADVSTATIFTVGVPDYDNEQCLLLHFEISK